MSLTIRMLGEYSLLADGVPLPIAGKPRFQLLIAYLILHQDRGLLRAQVAYDMWPDTSERQAQTNLRNLLFRLQQSIPLMRQCLQIDQTHIRWQPQIESQVDVLELQCFMDSAHGESDPQLQIDLYSAAVDQYRGNLLPTLHGEWVIIQQERYHNLGAEALQRLGDLETVLLTIDNSTPVWDVEFDWIIGAGDKSFTARLAGTLNSETGAVEMDGQVIEGWMMGAAVHEEGQMVDPETSAFEGVIQLHADNMAPETLPVTGGGVNSMMILGLVALVTLFGSTLAWRNRALWTLNR